MRGCDRDHEGPEALFRRVPPPRATSNEAPCKSAVELSARYIYDRKLPDKAIDVIDETGAAQMLLPPIQAPQADYRKGDRGDGRHDGAHSAKAASPRTTKTCSRNLEQELQLGGLRPGYGNRGPVDLDQAGACRASRAEQADRRLRLLRPDRRRQDGSGQAARVVARRRAAALRHVGVYGAAHGLAACSARLPAMSASTRAVF